ncbi:glycine oxidase ThiO [Nitratireductor pacificus]|uniref:Thiamine biosynthesis oxidoreductase THIO n=1 Tax=Nitratireductor pacificus pht-3B TaxID=391937 RepID=K2LNH5_9HYPH|nr:glycine oxidase ThiO [Nitratireductor pacificus]EKF19314.1 thiamine biosynthesis oxidoreductase THIO [Nitratireductor pacificus pht-3B]
MHVLVKGAGVAGLTLAHELAARGVRVTVADIRPDSSGSASWLAGGMLAPWCERESAEEPVLTLGRMAADWWDNALPGEVVRNGTLVVAPPRDAAELARFAARTGGHELIDGPGVEALELDLAGRFQRGLFFPGEAHLDPRRALTGLREKLEAMGVAFRFASETTLSADLEADCTGMADGDAELRGVRGEMLILHAPDVALSRPVRLLHPRIPVYVVPRADHRFMVGATMIESEDTGPVSVRSMMELLNAAYSLHPAFAEAKIVETGVGVRPAYADNLPRVTRTGRGVRVNGLYRHGFLLSPAMAREAAEMLLGEKLRCA